jgi:hypothetical protein
MVPGLNRVYEASSRGRVRITVDRQNIKAGDVLNMHRGKSGYPQLALNPEGGARTGYSERVHRVVAAAFHGPCPDGMQVNHKDGDITNNRPENLEYVSCLENIRHSIEVLGYTRKGELNPAAKLTEDEVIELRELAATKPDGTLGVPYRELGPMFGIAGAIAARIAKGEIWPDVGGPRTTTRPLGRRPGSGNRGPRSDTGLPQGAKNKAKREAGYAFSTAKVVELRETAAYRPELSYKELGALFGLGASAAHRLVTGQSRPEAGGPIRR